MGDVHKNDGEKDVGEKDELNRTQRMAKLSGKSCKGL